MSRALFALLLICFAFCVESAVNATTPVPPNAVPAEKTPEELADENSEHEKFLDSLEFDSNPYRHFRHTVRNATVFAQCSAGLCCTRRRTFFPYGHICGKPANPCQIAICSGQSAECYTIAAKNGTACANGSCYDGECVKNCIGECCEGKFAKQDGTECSDGMCVSGVCVRNCKGDCCEVGQSFAKPDGAPCDGGVCEKGECKIENASANDDIATTATSAVKQPVVAVIHEAEETPSTLDTVWKKLVGDEKADKKIADKKEAERIRNEKNAEAAEKIKIIKNDTENYQAALKAANEQNTSYKYSKIILIVAGAVAGFLLIVFIIVVIVLLCFVQL